MERDWYWEGHVQAALAQTLEAAGWEVRSSADTASKQQGVDLLLEREGRTLAIEVKGYPSESYADPRRAHETKRTNPRNQCEKWFSQALFKAMRLRSAMTKAEIAVAFPDFPRYQALLRETEDSIRRLGVGVYLVDESGSATLVVPHVRGERELAESLLPFDAYEGGGRQLMGVPRFGAGSSRRDYGVPVFEQCGWTCVYCGVDLGGTYETWLGLSVDHVVPQSLVKAGFPSDWIEDLANKVTCCRHCNEFLNQYRILEPPPDTLDDFFELRDRVFREKRAKAVERHGTERTWYEQASRKRGTV